MCFHDVGKDEAEVNVNNVNNHSDFFKKMKAAQASITAAAAATAATLVAEAAAATSPEVSPDAIAASCATRRSACSRQSQAGIRQAPTNRSSSSHNNGRSSRRRVTSCAIHERSVAATPESSHSSDRLVAPSVASSDATLCLLATPSDHWRNTTAGTAASTSATTAATSEE